MQHPMITAISMALKSRTEIEMDLKYPYIEQFKNNLLSLFPNAESLAALAKKANFELLFSDPSDDKESVNKRKDLFKKMIRVYDKLDLDLESMFSGLIDQFFEMFQTTPIYEFFNDMFGLINDTYPEKYKHVGDFG